MSYEANRRYTDRDVRESNELHQFAERYIQVYEGDFQPLLDAKAAMVLWGYLEPPVARVVLNCARLDSRYSDQIPARAPALELIQGGGSYQEHLPGDLFKESAKARRPKILKPKFKIKNGYEWGKSDNAQAYLVHLIGRDSHVNYWTPPINEMQFILMWECGARPSRNSGVTFLKEPEHGARVCKRCIDNSTTSGLWNYRVKYQWNGEREVVLWD